MPVTDPIADMLTRIRNAVAIRRDTVRVHSSKVCVALAEVLTEEGFLGGFEVVENPKTKAQNDLLLKLKYGRAGEQVIRRIDRVSKPGRRIYKKVKEIKTILHGLGIEVLSTPKGVMSDRKAKEAKVGGEVLCVIE